MFPPLINPMPAIPVNSGNSEPAADCVRVSHVRSGVASGAASCESDGIIISFFLRLCPWF